MIPDESKVSGFTLTYLSKIVRCPEGCRFLGRHARHLCDADLCLASEKRSSGKSRGFAWWGVCCYGDLGSVLVSDPA